MSYVDPEVASMPVTCIHQQHMQSSFLEAPCQATLRFLTPFRHHRASHLRKSRQNDRRVLQLPLRSALLQHSNRRQQDRPCTLEPKNTGVDNRLVVRTSLHMHVQPPCVRMMQTTTKGSTARLYSSVGKSHMLHSCLAGAILSHSGSYSLDSTPSTCWGCS